MNGEKLNLILVSASSEYSESTPATEAFDGDTSTYWRTESNPKYPQEIVVELDNFYKLCGFRIFPNTMSSRVKSFKILVSSDNSDFQEIYSNTCLAVASYSDFEFSNELSSKYVKIEFEGNSTSKLQVYDFELYGELSATETYYQIKESTLTSLADQARRINGTTDDLTTAQMLEIFESAKVNGTLDGLANGYDVMFYDENNEGLAFYSIKQGHTINPPVYNCKNWQDANGGVIVFPHTPNADAIFYANNSTYADQLYKFYGVDKGIYPYLIIEHGGTNTNGNGFVLVRIWFASDITIGASAISFSSTNLVGGGQTHKPSQWSDDLAEFVSQVMERITTLATASSQSLSAKVQFREAYEGPSKYSAKAYLNFDCSLTVRTLYRLDE